MSEEKPLEREAGEFSSIVGGILFWIGVIAVGVSFFLPTTVDVPSFSTTNLGIAVEDGTDRVINLEKVSDMWTVRAAGLAALVAGILFWTHGAAERSRAAILKALSGR